jgi:tetratricopeptide (TPR) repeat protein
MVGKSLRVYKSNKPAQILKDKLDAVKADLDKEKLNMAKEYCQNASHLFRKGLVLEAMLDVKKSLLLDPNSIETRNLDDKILSSIKSITDKVNEDYRKKFRQAIEYFIDGNIEKSEKYFRMLENQTDSADYFLPIVISHHSDKSNYDRSNLYYEEALNQLNETRYAMAKESLMLALRLDKDNLDARLLLTLVKELELAAE